MPATISPGAHAGVIADADRLVERLAERDGR
jgi:hypothetical protein